MTVYSVIYALLGLLCMLGVAMLAVYTALKPKGDILLNAAGACLAVGLAGFVLTPIVQTLIEGGIA